VGTFTGLELGIPEGGKEGPTRGKAPVPRGGVRQSWALRPTSGRMRIWQRVERRYDDDDDTIEGWIGWIDRMGCLDAEPYCDQS
jgi:hypothetical protein